MPCSGGSVGVILNSREDWAPSVDPSTKIEEEAPEFSVKIKGRRDDDTLDLRQPSQADWIRQYMEQQQEVQREAALAFLHTASPFSNPSFRIEILKYMPFNSSQMLKLSPFQFDLLLTTYRLKMLGSITFH